jgi:exosortase/archaeosortase family protein
MTDNAKRSRKYTNVLIRLLPVLSFVVPFLVLYFDRQTSILYYSFDMTWKGRAFYIFFLWLASLEIIMEWDVLQSMRITKLKSVRTVVFILALLLPTIYLVASNYYSFPSGLVIDWSWRIGLDQPSWIPLDVEYFVLAALFVLIVWLQFGGKGLRNILIAPAFLATIGAVYTIDNFYRNGSFTPFQVIVPTTASLAANVLNFLGYKATLIGTYDGMPVLQAIGSHGSWSAAIAWPCSGVESLLIYSVTILLFLKVATISWRQGIFYFAFGAAVTYFINILRIATIFILAVNTGGYYAGSEAEQFHDFYGQLYSVIWIASYPLIIVGSQALWRWFRNGKATAQIRPDSISDIELPKQL